MSETATLEHHTYAVSGKPFAVVICRACSVALNSGHHYTPDGYHYAEALASTHNADHHAA